MIIGLAETHRLDTEELTVKGFKFIGQGRSDGVHREGVGFILSKFAADALQPNIRMNHHCSV